MQFALFAILLVVGGCQSAPREGRSIGPLADFNPIETLTSFNPLESLTSFLGIGVDDEKDDAGTHELISLDEFPVWRVHHYSGIDLKPVKESVAPAPAYGAPDTTYVTAEKPVPEYSLPPAEAAAEEAAGLEHLELLSTGLTALSTIRETLNSMRDTVAALPKLVLSAIGLRAEEDEYEEVPEEEVEVEEEDHDSTSYTSSSGLPALPELSEVIELPASVLNHLPKLPKLPFKLPIKVKGKGKKKPAIYVVVNKPAKEEKEVVVKEEYGVPKEPITIYEAPKPVPSGDEQPPFKLPSEYGAPGQKFAQVSQGPPEGLVLPVNLIRNSSPQDLHKLAITSTNALSQFNSANEAVDAIQSLNEINSLGNLGASERVSGFQPSQGVNKRVQARVDIEVVPAHDHLIQPSSTVEKQGHVATSVPARASPPDFKASQADPVIVLPSNTQRRHALY